MQTDIAQNLLKMQNHSSECVFRTLITPEINYLGFGMHIDRFGTSFEIRKIGLKKSLCCESEPECLGVCRNFWRQQKLNFRKVPIEKVRFAPRIDIIAHKLAPVASGEVGEYL